MIILSLLALRLLFSDLGNLVQDEAESAMVLYIYGIYCMCVCVQGVTLTKKSKGKRFHVI